MKISVKNMNLELYIELLMGTTTKISRDGRAVSRFSKMLMKKYEEYSTFEREIVEEYCVVDGNGDPVPDDNGKMQFKPETIEDGIRNLYEVRNEIAIIDLTEFEPMIKPLISALDNSDQVLSGYQLSILDELMTSLEDIVEEGGE